MNMVERVARAIARDDYDGDDLWDELGPGIKAAYTANARAAIEAMREPQVEMIAAFWRQKNTGTQEIGGSGDNRSDYDAWRAAIDAALSE